MRRAVLAFGGTVAGLILLLSFRSHTAAPAAAGVSASGNDPAPASSPAMAAPADDSELVPAALTPAEAVELVCERNDNSRIRPATVLPKARTARRMGSPINEWTGQNSKLSWWIRRRGTPASRSAEIAVSVMPGGPHT